MTIQEIKDYIKGQLTMSGIDATDISKYLDGAIDAGLSLFWRNSWKFNEDVGTFTTTASTFEYNVRTNLSDEINAIMSIQRLSSDDYGWNLIARSKEEFDTLHPYPDSETTDEPQEYTVYYKDKDIYIELWPVPDSAYTMRVRFQYKWDKSRLDLIPDDYNDTVKLACLMYAAKVEYRSVLRQEYLESLKRALKHDAASKKRRVVMRVPEHIGIASERDRALNRGVYDPTIDN